MAGHDHSRHHHDHGHKGSLRSLRLSFLLIFGFMLVEALGGWLTNSLALLSDAGHMLTDAGALGLSMLAMHVGTKPPSSTKTFGYRRLEILAALFNGLALWVIVGVILHEAWIRFRTAPEVQAPGMIAVASVGLVVNLLAISLLHSHKDENLNVRGAFLHVVADSLGSVGALAAGLIILTTGWSLADPLVSVGICILVLWSSWGLVREAVHVLLLGVPGHIDYHDVQSAIMEHEGVCCLYDLHIWSIASGHEAISAHVVVPDGFTGQKRLLHDIVTTLRERYGIDHSTLQIEESHSMKKESHGLVCRAGWESASCHHAPGEKGQE